MPDFDHRSITLSKDALSLDSLKAIANPYVLQSESLKNHLFLNDTLTDIIIISDPLLEDSNSSMDYCFSWKVSNSIVIYNDFYKNQLMDLKNLNEIQKRVDPLYYRKKYEVDSDLYFNCQSHALSYLDNDLTESMFSAMKPSGLYLKHRPIEVCVGSNRLCIYKKYNWYQTKINVIYFPWKNQSKNVAMPEFEFHNLNLCFYMLAITRDQSY
jgi:hypothetical protein